MNGRSTISFITTISFASALAACASKEQMAEFQARNAQPYVSEMQQVIPHVTQAHLDSCKSKIESRESALGIKWRLVGPLQPHATSTCVARTDRNWRYSDAKVAAYLAPATSSATAPFLPKRQAMGCIFILRNGKLDMDLDAPMQVVGNTQCRYM